LLGAAFSLFKHSILLKFIRMQETESCDCLRKGPKLRVEPLAG